MVLEALEKRNDLCRTIILLRHHAGSLAGGSGSKAVNFLHRI